VRVLGPNGEEIARGLARLSALEVARAAGKKGEELSAALGGAEDEVVIHKDDLVPFR
jgi:glutamate 5-kinase